MPSIKTDQIKRVCKDEKCTVGHFTAYDDIDGQRKFPPLYEDEGLAAALRELKKVMPVKGFFLSMYSRDGYFIGTRYFTP